MLQKLPYKQKQILMAIAMLAGLYIAYQLSFKKAVQAIRLHNQLVAEKDNGSTDKSSFVQLSRKYEFYQTILKRYKVNSTDFENQIWQNLSDMAVKENVKISFNPMPNIEPDTMKVSKGIVEQGFAFKGNYFRLVGLLDTISRSSSIGKIATMKLGVKKDDFSAKENNELMLQLGIIAIAK